MTRWRRCESRLLGSSDTLTMTSPTGHSVSFGMTKGRLWIYTGFSEYEYALFSLEKAEVQELRDALTNYLENEQFLLPKGGMSDE